MRFLVFIALLFSSVARAEGEIIQDWSVYRKLNCEWLLKQQHPIASDLFPEFKGHEAVNFSGGVYQVNYRFQPRGKTTDQVRAALAGVPFYQWNSESNAFLFKPGHGHRFIFDKLGKVTLYRVVTSLFEINLYQQLAKSSENPELLEKLEQVSKYGMIFTDPSYHRMSGSKDGPTYIMEFEVDFANMPDSLKDEVYAGFEYESIEIAFITLAARRWLVHHFKPRYRTIEVDGRYFMTELN